MNEEEEEEANESDRTLIGEDEDEEVEKKSGDYRMATMTPSVNTKQVGEEIEDDADDDDEEATMADPTLISLMRTPLPDPQVLKEQQEKNMKRLMEKIERQRQAAQHRLSDQQGLIVPSTKTPQRLIVSPGYGANVSSTNEQRQEKSICSSSSSTTSTIEIEERRLQLEFVSSSRRERERVIGIDLDVENNFSKIRFVIYPNERIFPIHWSVVHRSRIFQLKVSFEIFVQRVKAILFSRLRHHFTLLRINEINNKNNSFKLFKRSSLPKNLKCVRHLHLPRRRALLWKKINIDRVRKSINEERNFNSIDTKVIHQKIEIILSKISLPVFSPLNNNNDNTKIRVSR